jgi:ABC-type lipoprotein release transport system permease subunit
MRFLFAVAWRNLWRHSRRTLITATAMGVGVAMCMATIALQDGMFLQMFDVMVTDTLGHVQLHHPEYPGKKRLHDTMKDGEALVAQAEALDGVEGTAPRLMAFALAGGEEKSAGAQIMGVSPAREAALTGIDAKLTDGAWLPEEPGLKIVVGHELAKDLKVGVGDELVLVGQDAYGGMANDLFEIVGIARTGKTAMDRGGVWVHLADLQTFQALDDQLHELLIVGDDAEQAAALKEQVVTMPASEGALVQTWREADPPTAAMMDSSDATAFILLFVVLSVSALGILNTMLMSVFERMKEFGVLRALGLRPGKLIQVVVLESMLLAGIATTIGLVLGGALDAYLVIHGIDFSASSGEGFSFAGLTLDPVIHGTVRPEGIVITVAAVIICTLAAAIWPALRAARLEPVEAMREN